MLLLMLLLIFTISYFFNKKIDFVLPFINIIIHYSVNDTTLYLSNLITYTFQNGYGPRGYYPQEPRYNFSVSE